MQTSDRPIPGRRRFRFTIRGAMLAMPVVALIMAYAAAINPFERDPYAVAVGEVRQWTSQSVDSFGESSHVVWSSPEPTFVVDKPAAPALACILKIGYVERSTSVPRNPVFLSYFAVAVDGRTHLTRDVRNWAVQGGSGSIEPPALATLRQLLAGLPASPWIPPDRNPLLVGFRQGGGWVTRTYDRDHPPPEVRAVLAHCRQ